MAHREQHGNREAKKPRKKHSKDAAQAQSKTWIVSEAFEVQTKPGH
jgi:hypothetical protein